MSYWRSFLPIGAGIGAGLLVLFSLRVVYYREMSIHPNVGPETAFVFLPIVAAFLLACSMLLEIPLRFIWSPTTFLGAATIGLSYAAALSWWAFPEHWYLVLLVNPFLWRVVGLTTRSRGDARRRARP